MKINKFRYDIMLLVGLPWFIGMFALYLFVPQWILFFYRIHWLILIATIIIALSPWGKIKLASNNSTIKKPFLPWLYKTLLFQGSLIALLLGITELIQIYPSFLFLNTKNLFSSTWTTLFQTYGCYPWGLISLFAISMGYFSFCKKQDAFIHTLLKIKDPKSFASVNFNFDAKMTSTIALSSSCAFGVIFLALLFSALISPLTPGLMLTTLIIIMVLLFVVLSHPFRIFLNYFFEKKINVFTSMLLVLLALALFITLLNFIFHGLHSYTLQTPAFLAYFTKIGMQNVWQIFVLCWLGSWVPLASIYLISIAEGLKIREVIFGILLGPIIFGALIKFNINLNFFDFRSLGILNLMIGTLGVIGLLWPLTQKKMLTAMSLSYLPAATNIKHRDYHLLLRRTFQFAAFIIYLLLPTGVIFLAPLFFSMTISMMILAPFVLKALFSLLLQDT